MSNVIDTGEGFVVIDGQIVERDALNIAEKIREYDENLELMCLDPDKAGVNDAPFVVLEKLPNGTMTVAFEAWQLDDRLLERIYQADGRRLDTLAHIEGVLSKPRRDNERRYAEKREENKELMLAVFKSEKSSFTIKNKEGDSVKLNEFAMPTLNGARKSFNSVGSVAPSKRTTPRKEK